jgi:hypothetical protein
MNSYVLESLQGEQLPGTFSARRLRRFIPKDGTKLAEEQKRIEGLNTQREQHDPGGTKEGVDETPARTDDTGSTPSSDDSGPDTQTSG